MECKYERIPVVVGALVLASKTLKRHLKEIGIPNRVETLQRWAVLGTATILRKAIEV